MASAEQLILKSTQKIVNDLKNVVDRSVKKATGKMIDANEEQLDNGRLNTGSPITPEYSPSYAEKKGFPTPNLKDTGDWRNSIFINVKPDELTWGATDSKDRYLTAKYGEDIKGLEEKRAEEVFNKYVYPPINVFINKTVEKNV